ncbi:MAG: SEC10/PgrA surface exclusion domain-containing protein [Lactobacillus sp.]
MTVGKKKLATVLAACALALSTGAAPATVSAAAETPMSGVLTVRYFGRGKVRLVDQNGHFQNQYVAHLSQWRVFGMRQINGKTYYRIGNERQYVPAQYTNWGDRSQQPVNSAEQPLNGVVQVNYAGRGSVRLKDGSGHFVNQYVKKNSRWHVFAKKTVNGVTMYRLGNDRQWLPAMYASWVSSSAANLPQSGTHFQKAAITLPSGYTRENLLAAYRNPNSTAANAIKQASAIGIRSNIFVAENSADNNQAVNPTNLTPAQQQEISDFAVRVLNSARSQIGSQPFYVNHDIQQLANDVATEYQNNNKGINDASHYIEGLERAGRKNGLNTVGNQMEDEGGFYAGDSISMSTLKAYVYWNIEQMLFGGAISDNGPFYEYYHAGDLMNVRGWPDDGEGGPLAVSFSRQGNLVSSHFIHVSQAVYDYWK